MGCKFNFGSIKNPVSGRVGHDDLRLIVYV
jgi:hypothetical protein